jgi:flagellar FliL protein
MDITLEVEDQYAERIEGYRSRIADRLVQYAQTLDYDDLTRPKATVRLKPDLLSEINSASAPVKVKDLIFREFLLL